MRKLFSILFKRILPALLLVVMGAVAALFWGRSVMRTNVENVQTRVGESVVDVSEFVEIGGIPQWVQIRGQDKKNPVLLFLHGGPGLPTSRVSYSFQYPWEDFFTVVQWDQRGAGRSLPESGFPVETMTIDRMVQDTIELVEHLRTRFDQEKVFVVGDSWGTVLGSVLAKRRPDLLYAYIGIGQVVSFQKACEESRRLLIEAARERGDQVTIDALVAAGPMPEPSDLDAYFTWLNTIQSPLLGYGKVWHNQTTAGPLASIMIATAVMSPDSTLSGLYASRGGEGEKYRGALFDDVHNFDVTEVVGYDFDVPVIMVMGAHDWVTPVTLARAYFQDVRAPYKKFIELENSAHSVLYEESGKLFGVLIGDALPWAQRADEKPNTVQIQASPVGALMGLPPAQAPQTPRPPRTRATGAPRSASSSSSQLRTVGI